MRRELRQLGRLRKDADELEQRRRTSRTLWTYCNLIKQKRDGIIVQSNAEVGRIVRSGETLRPRMTNICRIC